MAIEVTARHMHASEGLQDYAREKAQAIVAEFPRVEHVHVVLDVEKRLHRADVTVQAGNHIRLDASHATENFRASIDEAIDKVEKQLRKHRDRVQDHKTAMRHEETTRKASEEE